MDSIALAALAELAVPPAVDLHLLEAIATHVWDARKGPGVDGLAQGQGARVTRDDALPRPWRALLIDDEIIVRPCRDPSAACVAVAHELAHWTATRAGLSLAHPDVWRLTLAILVPQQALATGATVGDIAAATGAPWWAAAYRVEARLTL